MHVALRADASPTMGSGHVVRCLALAEEGSRRGHRVVLHSHRLPTALGAWAESLGIETVDVMDPPGSADDARSLLAAGAKVHVVDGYHFGDSFYDRHPAKTGRPVLVIVDDNREVPLARADLVVNPGAHAARTTYPEVPEDRLAIGPDHAILRRSIVEAAHSDGPRTGGRNRVLVSLGGTDPLGLTGPVVEALLQIDDICLRVTSGALVDGGIPGTAVEPANDRTTEVVGDLADSLAWADVAVLGAGTALWEAAHLGVPVVSVVVADNQEGTSAAAATTGFAVRVDGRTDRAPAEVGAAVRSLLADDDRCAAMAEVGRRLVDGRGVTRIWEALEVLTGLDEVATTSVDDPISFRHIADEDRDRLFDWRNRPEVALHLFGPAPIARADHDRWFDALADNPGRRSWIVLVAERPVGLLNLTDITGQDGTCVWGGYVADPEDRGQGVGRAMVEFGLEHAFETLGVASVKLEVYADNDAAVRLYHAAGFATTEERTAGNRPVLLMVIDRDDYRATRPSRSVSLPDSRDVTTSGSRSPGP